MVVCVMHSTFMYSTLVSANEMSQILSIAIATFSLAFNREIVAIDMVLCDPSP